MSRVNLTRMSLLQKRAELKTSTRGAEVLRSKRDALLRELYRAAQSALEYRLQAVALASRASVALAEAQAVEGEASLRSLAAAARREVRVDVQSRNVWGVRFPSIASVPAVRRAIDRGYGLLSVSATVDDAAEASEQLLHFVLENAQHEIRLRRLAAELKRTHRKVNTLEHQIIPRLERTIREIEMALEEQEREDRFRTRLARRDGC